MSDNTQTGLPGEPIHIFVSYAREDSRWLDVDYRFNLIPYLVDSLRKENIEFWIDRKLVIADEYRTLIESEIDRAQIALLIVSQYFLNSRFIETVEMPRIQQRAQQGELLIAPVLVEPCDWKEYPLLADRQMMPASSPLINYTDNEAKWAGIKFEILDGLKTQIKRIRKTAPKPGKPLAEGDIRARVHREGIQHWAWIGGVLAALVLLAVLAFFHFTKRSAQEGSTPVPAPVPARESQPSNTPQPTVNTNQQQSSDKCVNLSGEWRTTPDLTEMHVTQSGCKINGWFNSSDTAYRHTFTGELHSNRASIVVDRTDPQGCLTKMYGALRLNEGRLIYTINGTEGNCHVSAQWTETRIWTVVE
jgi:hypothetical protein